MKKTCAILILIIGTLTLYPQNNQVDDMRHELMKSCADIGFMIAKRGGSDKELSAIMDGLIMHDKTALNKFLKEHQ